jgi:hypothetical protein
MKIVLVARGTALSGGFAQTGETPQPRSIVRKSRIDLVLFPYGVISYTILNAVP